MNPDFNRLLEASNDDRLDLSLATATRLGTPVQNVEKDFWVCWPLDSLFNGLESSGPRLLFKGGTSLSESLWIGGAEPTASRCHRRCPGPGKRTAQRHRRAGVGDERPRTRHPSSSCQPPLRQMLSPPTTLRAIRCRAALRGWAFDPTNGSRPAYWTRSYCVTPLWGSGPPKIRDSAKTG